MSQGIDISDFSGGLNTRDGAGGIADNEIADCLNCYLVKRGYAKRKGYSRYTGSNRIDTANAGTFIADATFAAATKIVAGAGSKLAYKSGTAWSDITGSVTVSATRAITTTMVNDNLVGCDGLHPAFYWSGFGNAQTLSGDNVPTVATTCEEYSGRLFIGSGRRLSWSGWMGDWGKFNSKDYQDFSSKIMGLKVIGDSNDSMLLVLCQYQVAVCTFTTTVSETIGGRGAFTFDVISNSNGCAAPASVREVYVPNLGYAVVWVDYDGLKIYSPAIGIEKLTDKIRDNWEALDLADIEYFNGVFYRPKGWYILNCRDSIGTVNNKQIVIDFNNSNPGAVSPDARWIISGVFDWTASAFGTVRESGVEKLVGCDGDGYWNRYDDTQNDNGAAIDAYFKTKSFDAGLPHYTKGFQALGMHYTYFGGFDIDITVYYDFLGESYSVTHTATAATTLGNFVLDQDILGADDQLVVTAEELVGWGRTAQFRIGNANVGEPFRIHKLQPQFRVGRRSILQ